MGKNLQPFFSIGVTTYDRIDLLKEALASIVSQTFPDFEVIIGNDNPHQVLSSEILSINDERLSFVNLPTNLGELANMNDLLARSRGRYFTWLADDDVYNLGFLESVYHSLNKLDYPLVVFTSYIAGSKYLEQGVCNFSSEYETLTGKEFLGKYLSRSLKVIGCYGLFESNYLKFSGGMERLGNGFSPYSDNLLAIRAGLLDDVVYHHAELVFFRTHETSVSYTSPNINVYASAQADFLAKSLDIFMSDSLKDSFHSYLFMLVEWCIKDFDSVIRRSGTVSRLQLSNYFHMIRKYLAHLSGSSYYKQSWMIFTKICLLLIRDIILRRIRLKL